MQPVAGPVTAFKDHFSARADLYARYRPSYPDAMFDDLAGRCARRHRAWDCATGNGQAAVALARYFEHVVATDASARQIAAAIRTQRVEYRVAHAENSGLDAHSVDLVSVGQALHWFDRQKFFREAQRVLAPAGVLAAWCYELCRVDPPCDAIVDELYTGLLDGMWPPERVHIERGYADIAFPGVEIAAPDLAMETDWSVDDMLGYLRTWSACRRFEAVHAEDPVTAIEPALRAAWGGVRRHVRWPLRIRISRL